MLGDRQDGGAGLVIPTSVEVAFIFAHFLNSVQNIPHYVWYLNPKHILS